jgi:hypothetical protein
MLIAFNNFSNFSTDRKRCDCMTASVQLKYVGQITGVIFVFFSWKYVSRKEATSSCANKYIIGEEDEKEDCALLSSRILLHPILSLASLLLFANGTGKWVPSPIAFCASKPFEASSSPLVESHQGVSEKKGDQLCCLSRPPYLQFHHPSICFLPVPIAPSSTPCCRRPADVPSPNHRRHATKQAGTKAQRRKLASSPGRSKYRQVGWGMCNLTTYRYIMASWCII